MRDVFTAVFHITAEAEEAEEGWSWSWSLNAAGFADRCLAAAAAGEEEAAHLAADK